MENKKVHIEQVNPSLGSSFAIQEHSRNYSRNKSQWHAHSEFELVYITNGSGQRHISNSLTSYKDGDLIFIGPNLPHFGFSERLEEAHTEVVIQMSEQFIEGSIVALPEFEAISVLLQRARNGISFRGQFKHEIGTQMMQMIEMEPMPRLLKLFEILDRMSKTTSYRSLHAELIDFKVDGIVADRLRVISEYVKDRYHEPLVVADVASEVGMTIPAFCRFFKKATNKTFNQFLNEYRIGYARRMIRKSSLTLSAISQDCGFGNISNFNRQFKRITGETPSAFRKRHLQLVTT